MLKSRIHCVKCIEFLRAGACFDDLLLLVSGAFADCEGI